MLVADVGQYLVLSASGPVDHVDIAAAGPNPAMMSINF
jgi:hypothetical protein